MFPSQEHNLVTLSNVFREVILFVHVHAHSAVI